MLAQVGGQIAKEENKMSFTVSSFTTHPEKNE